MLRQKNIQIENVFLKWFLKYDYVSLQTSLKIAHIFIIHRPNTLEVKKTIFSAIKNFQNSKFRKNSFFKFENKLGNSLNY